MEEEETRPRAFSLDLSDGHDEDLFRFSRRLSEALFDGRCHVCRKRTSEVCQGCKVVRYCGEGCQSADAERHNKGQCSLCVEQECAEKLAGMKAKLMAGSVPSILSIKRSSGVSSL